MDDNTYQVVVRAIGITPVYRDWQTKEDIKGYAIKVDGSKKEYRIQYSKKVSFELAQSMKELVERNIGKHLNIMGWKWEADDGKMYYFVSSVSVQGEVDFTEIVDKPSMPGVVHQDNDKKEEPDWNRINAEKKAGYEQGQKAQILSSLIQAEVAKITVKLQKDVDVKKLKKNLAACYELIITEPAE